MGSMVSYGQLSRAKPPSSCTSYRSTTSKMSAVSKRADGHMPYYRLIEWYFYPEFAPKKLFTNQSVQWDLRQVTGRHYEVLS